MPCDTPMSPEPPELRVQDDAERKAESQRILDRIAKESHLGQSHLRSERTKAEQDAVDQARIDPIEQLGTKIGRTLGLIITIAICAWLAAYIFGII
jgi:hypothetical protein